ncbi:MCE family protein [Mycobacterium paraseoulense]|uniref:Mammalian cell entry protein n=1 Tax=Mycobacterium paraseoulense TaxID=590652 RepID=A0A1X0I7Y4_9MYCO|nr:MCE family protein [Mycobacterium paraseoulense]MCV7393950.1 MCE family protein [Mycobacterium paraseoulense]ORB38386.1 mammalian cell entry protein [Mycobacterium paraseoulense]BBZ70421.1 Mce family protein Mce3D [Mycobacterium paraseoulense]
MTRPVAIPRGGKIALAISLVICLAGGITVVALKSFGAPPTNVIAYFENSNGIFAGDDVMILGVRVGKIDKIEPQPDRARISFHIDGKHKVPANANAVIINPTLVSARALQLTPAYAGGPVMSTGAVIPQQRTAVPVEFDDLRKQLEKLTQSLQPTEPGGVSTMGALVDTAADNLRGQGADIRDAIIHLSQALSALGDHSNDIFGSVKNLSILVSALRSSRDLLRQLNRNLAAVTALLADDPDKVGGALRDLNAVVGDVQSFIADNRESLGTTSDKLASISGAVVNSLDDLKQTLHIAPSTFANFNAIYDPANASLTGVLGINNFADPIGFLCGAIQAASRLNNQQSAKLCVQYLAPIIKNRQYNFLPLGENFFVGPKARPNEVTFSEDWLRPLTEPGRIRDRYEGPLPDEGPPQPPATGAPPPDTVPAPIPAGATPSGPAAGLSQMMMPPGGAS